MNKNKSIVKRNVKYFLPVAFKKYPSYIFLNVFKILFNSITPLMNVVIPKYIIQELLGQRDLEIIILYVLILVLGNVISKLLLNYIEMHIILINDRLSKHFDTIRNSKAMQMDFEYCENPEVCDLLEKGQRGMNNYTNGIGETVDTFSGIISDIIVFGGVIAIIITTKLPLLIAISIVSVILSLLINNREQKLEVKFNDSMTRINRRFWYYFFELVHIQTAKEARLYHAQKMIKDVCEHDNEKASKEWRTLSIHYAKNGSLQNLYTYLIEKILCYIILIYGVIEKTIDLADLTMLIVAIETFTGSLGGALRKSQALRRIAKYQNTFIDFMEYPIKKKSGILIPDKMIRSIEFRNVSFKYPNTNDYILKDMNIKIDSKERLSIVGLNGAGKTTLVKLLCRLYDVTEGVILVNDIDIKEYNYEEYLKLFSIVFQDFKIISFSIKENVAVSDDNQERLYSSLERAGVLEYILSLPKKENTFINKWFDDDGVALSGGELQKLAIARALYKDSPIVILDEPTAALDPLAEARIYQSFHEIIGEKATIFISHRLSSCRFCDRIIVIDGKQIVEMGTHDELMTIKNGVYQTMFRAQAQYYN